MKHPALQNSMWLPVDASFNEEEHEFAEHIQTTEILNSKGSLL